MDGQQQRRALTAAESALRALAAGDGDRAVAAAVKAAELDQIGVFSTLEPAVAAAAEDVARTGVIGEFARRALGDAVSPGPLASVVEALP